MAYYTQTFQEYGGSIQWNNVTTFFNGFTDITAVNNSDSIDLKFKNRTDSFIRIEQGNSDARYPGPAFTLYMNGEAVTNSQSINIHYLSNSVLGVYELNGGGILIEEHGYNSNSHNVDGLHAMAVFVDSDIEEIAVIGASNGTAMRFSILENSTPKICSLNAQGNGIPAGIYVVNQNVAQLVNLCLSDSDTNYRFCEKIFLQVTGGGHATYSGGAYRTIHQLRLGNKYFYLVFINSANNNLNAPLAFEFTDKVS